MATSDEIAQLRLLVDETGEETYTDTILSDRIDGATSIEALAAELWTEKAARYAGLVDISEGGSSRRMGALQANALKMREVFAGLVEAGDPGGPGGIRIRKIRRP